MTGWRSLLFVPGDAPDKLAKAATRGADAVIIDLEDAVPHAAKPAARTALAHHVAALRAQGAEVLVRINAPWLLAAADLEAAMIPGISALLTPKAEQPGHLAVLAEMMGEWEAARGLPPGGTGLVALVETSMGLARLNDIAAVPRVMALAFGSEDFCAGLGVEPSATVLDLPCRQMALAAGARGLLALGLPVSLALFRDLDAYAEAARRARSIGMTGALCIHPAQVPVLNQAFQPTPAQIDKARTILAAWEAAQARGQAVAALDGAMIDRPVVEQARRLLARVRRRGGKPWPSA